MVRLKVDFVNWIELQHRRFNSNMVRLKATAKKAVKNNKQSFNSNMVRLKDSNFSLYYTK